MDAYKQAIISKLTLDDVLLLGVLYENDATMTHKAMRKKSILEKSSLTDAKYKKSLYRLSGSCLIEAVSGITDQRLFLTSEGYKATEIKLEGDES